MDKHATGDGDYQPLYRMLIALKKQVIVVYTHGHLGRETYRMSWGLYKKPANKVAEVFK